MLFLKRSQNSTIVLLLIILIFIQGGGMIAGERPRREFYVAQQDKNSSDNNFGTLEHPFKSINGCLRKIKLQPGDTVWIKNGTYREALLLKSATTRRRWNGDIIIPSGNGYSSTINICGYPGEKPVIKGSDVVTGWKKYKNNIWVHDKWPVNTQQMFADGELLTQIGGKMASGSVTIYWRWEYKGKTLKDMIPGSFYCDEKGKKLYVWLNGGKDPNHAMMEASTRLMTILLWKLKYIRMCNLKITHGNNFSSNSAITVLSDNCMFEDIDQSLHAFGGIKLGGEYNLVNRCKFNMNGDYGMGGFSRGHRVLNSETNFNNYRNWSVGWHAGGVKFISDCHDWVLKGHVSAYNNADGIWFDDGMSNVTIEGCKSYRNNGYGIHYEIGSRGIIKNNICYENIGRGIYISNSSYTLVANNLCYRNGMSGIVSIGVKRKGTEIYNRGKDNVMPAAHNLVTGNIMIDNCSCEWLLKHIDSWPMPESFKKRFVNYAKKFKSWGYRPELIMPNDSDSNAGCFSDYNIFYRSGKRNNPDKLRFGRNWNIKDAVGLNSWRQKTGFDKHSKFVKPEFVNIDKYDFHPTDTSPALWFGQKTDQAIRYDFNNVRRPGVRPPRTAGPYSGSMGVFNKLKQNPTTSKYDIISLPSYPARDMDNLWLYVRMSEVGMVKSLGLKAITPVSKGVYIEGVPYLVVRGNGVMLNRKHLEKIVKCGKSVRKINFLFTAVRFSTKTFLQCIIHREDGVKVRIDFKGSANDGIMATSDRRDLHSTIAWQGKLRSGKNSRVFTITWENSNEWLPVKNIEFKLLDQNAEIGIISITSEKLSAK